MGCFSVAIGRLRKIRVYFVIVFSIPLAFMAIVPVLTHSVLGGEPLAAITLSDTIVIRDGSIIPQYPKPGRWTEFERKSSDRFESRQFRYMVPGESPAIELYVVTDKRDEPPDGAFEIGLVRGYLRGFATKGGFTYDDPVINILYIGRTRVLHALVKLTGGRKTLWVHAYIFLRQPSLTFIAIRGVVDAQEGIEKYLATVDFRK